MKILILCNKPPYPATEGGPMAMNSIIKGLLKAGHHVKILAINNEKFNVTEADIPDDYRKETGIELIDVDLSIKPFKAFLNLFSRKSYHVKRFISKDFENRLVEVLKKEHFDVVQLEMLREGDWGPWGDADGTMHVNFLSDNDITGGNSGSPVMDADGNLVGLAFDGNKESLCSNYWFHPDMCKCVNVDIRYVLWILDRYAGMNYLFDEMDIIKP